MACCALAVIILLQILAPVRWVKEHLGIARRPNEEINWQLITGPVPLDSPPLRVSRRSRIFILLLAIELAVLGALAIPHLVNIYAHLNSGGTNNHAVKEADSLFAVKAADTNEFKAEHHVYN